jgi:hypothetical protein
MRLSGKINAPYTYLIIVVLLFTVLPVVHRLVDWRVGYSDQSIISVLPLLAMLPAAAIVLYTGRIGRLPKPLLACVWLWFGGFAFALGVGALSGNAVAALYSFVQFILPALLQISCFGSPSRWGSMPRSNSSQFRRGMRNGCMTRG